MLRKFKSLGFTKEENIVRDLTKDDDTEPSPKLLLDLSRITREGSDETYKKILTMLSKRMTDYPKIKHVKKALQVVDYGLDYFCDKFVSDIAQQQSVIQRITKYRYYKNGETDIAGPVRELAAAILIKLSAEDDLAKTRSKKHPTSSASTTTSTKASSTPNPGKQPVQKEEEIQPAPGYQEKATTEAENKAVQFDDWNIGSVLVEGRTGSNEGRVNGIYSPREEQVNGKTSYMKDAMMLDDPIVLWYWDKNDGLWMISRESTINTDKCYACVKTGDINDPATIKSGKTWMVFDKDASRYLPDKNISIKALNK